MRYLKSKLITRLFVLLAAALVAPQSAPSAQASQPPDFTGTPCSVIQAPEGHKVSFHVYAKGVQIYKWNGAAWEFVGPVARLYANDSYDGEVGFHYAGPTWESNGGSKVVARRLQGCTPDASAIPFLLLETVTADGPGILKWTTFIQRTDTTGGLAPAAPGSAPGEVKEVPYTAEYYFYRAHN